MPLRSFLASPPRAVAAFAWGLAFVAGCSSSDRLESAGVRLRPPAGWKAVPHATWPVTGVPLAAWSGPGGASLVVHRSLPTTDDTAQGLAEGLVNRLENLPGLRVISSGTETVAGAPAARVEVTAPGFGDSLAPTGMGKPVALDGKTLQPTRRVEVTIPRRDDTITLDWHAPEADANALAATVRETLKSLTIRRDRPSTATY